MNKHWFMLLSAAARRLRPVLHWRALRVIRYSQYFDAAWYLDRHPELRRLRYDPALHYLIHGARQPLDPGPHFNVRGYLDAHPKLAPLRANPLLHYERARRSAPPWPAVLAADVEAGQNRLHAMLPAIAARHEAAAALPGEGGEAPWPAVLAADVEAGQNRLHALLPAIAARHEAAAALRGEGGEEAFSPIGNLAMLAAAGRPVSIIILGRHSQDWMEAVGPGAAVWHLLPEVARISIAESDPGPALTADTAAGLTPVVIPMMEAHARILGPDMPALSPEPALIDLLADKLVFDLYAAERHASARPAHITSAAELQMPCIVKHAGLNAGRSIMVAYDEAQLSSIFSDLRFFGQPKTIQAAVFGDREWVTHAVMRGGRLLWHASFEYQMPAGVAVREPETPIGIRCRPTQRPVLAFLRELGAALLYDGPLNIDYRLAAGKLTVFEVNPRLGGSLMKPAFVEHLAAAFRTIIDCALVTPLAEIIERSPLFDPTHYAALSHPQLPNAAPTALAKHYLLRGGHEGRDPGPTFSSRDYRALNPGQVPSEGNPLLHYELFGRARGLSVQHPARRRLALAAHRLAALPPGPSCDGLRLIPAREAARLIASEGLQPAGEVLHYTWDLERFHEQLFLHEVQGQLAIFALRGKQYPSTPLPLFTTPPAPALVLAEQGRHQPFWYLQLTDFEAFLTRRSAASRAPRHSFPSLATWKTAALEERFRLHRLPLTGHQTEFAAHFTRLKNPRHRFDGETCLAFYGGAARPAPAEWFAIYLLEDLSSGPPLAVALTIEHAGTATLLNLATGHSMVRPLVAMIVKSLATRGFRAFDAGVSGHFGNYKTAFFIDRRETDATGLPPPLRSSVSIPAGMGAQAIASN